MTASFIESWNAAGEAWLAWVVERSVVCAVALAVVGTVLALLRHRLSAHAPSHLLLLPLVLLVVPLERALPTSWPAALPATIVPSTDATRFAHGGTPTGSTRDADVVESTTSATAEPRASSQPNPVAVGSMPAVGYPALAFAAWLTCLLTGIGWLAIRQRRADRRLRALSHSVRGELRTRFEGLCGERGFDREIALRELPGLASPVASGIRRATVYVPADLATRLSPTQLRFVLLHELEHLARHDVAVEAALRMLRIGWWFHPGVWLVAAAHARWREYACDEAALARAGSPKRAPVADALVTLIDLANDRPSPSGAFAHFSLRNSLMKNRLTRIFDRNRTPRRSLSTASVLTIACTSLGALTVARAQQPTPRVEREVEAPVIEIIEVLEEEPNADVTAALDEATAWLVRAQRPDGRWTVGPDPTERVQRDHNEVHVTGLAIRALLPARGRGDVDAAISRGDAFLQSSQREDGRFGPDDALTVMFGHAQAIRALVAVQTVRPADDRKRAIERGVRWAEKARNPYMGWRYLPRSGDNDSKITALMLLALREAEAIGIEIDAAAYRGARELLDQLTHEDTGRTGFVSRGQTMSRFTSKSDAFPGELSEEPTAMHLLVAFAFDRDVFDDATLRKSVALLQELPPIWSRARGSIDYAYWNFGAQAMARVGGAQAERWRAHLHEALLSNRVAAGDGAAHWPAIDAWSQPGMETYATASAVLALRALP